MTTRGYSWESFSDKEALNKSEFPQGLSTLSSVKMLGWTLQNRRSKSSNICLRLKGAMSA